MITTPNFFIVLLPSEKKANTIRNLENEEGRMVTDESELGNVAVDYFENIIHSSKIGDLSHILSGVRLNVHT